MLPTRPWRFPGLLWYMLVRHRHTNEVNSRTPSCEGRQFVRRKMQKSVDGNFSCETSIWNVPYGFDVASHTHTSEIVRLQEIWTFSLALLHRDFLCGLGILYSTNFRVHPRKRRGWVESKSTFRFFSSSRVKISLDSLIGTRMTGAIILENQLYAWLRGIYESFKDSIRGWILY